MRSYSNESAPPRREVDPSVVEFSGVPFGQFELETLRSVRAIQQQPPPSRGPQPTPHWIASDPAQQRPAGPPPEGQQLQADTLTEEYRGALEQIPRVQENNQLRREDAQQHDAARAEQISADLESAGTETVQAITIEARGQSN